MASYRVGAIRDGSQLTIGMVGPWALQGVPKGSETLTTLNPTQLSERVSTYPGWGRPSWISGGDYVYNNSPSNHGGVVPTGGLIIDGYFVPAGTWVAQFYDCSASVVIIEGDAAGGGAAWPGVMFRGCRMRANWAAPGFANHNNIRNNGITWINYCDAGGLDVLASTVCVSIFESQSVGNGTDRQYLIRNYLSIATTLALGRCTGDAFIENFCEKVVSFTGDETYHLNGLGNQGDELATLWLRNNMNLSPQPDGASSNPFYHLQTTGVQMGALGAYPGTGINIDGSRGYQCRDNYLGGANYTLQLGVDKLNTSADVSNVVFTGNKFSTFYFVNIGFAGIAYKNPTWGVQGNVWSNNTYADDYGSGIWSYTTANTLRGSPAGNGSNAGTTISAPVG